LIEAIKKEIEVQKGSHIDKLDFFESSTKFSENEWQRLLQETTDSLDIMGIALMAWRQTIDFEDTVMKKAAEGCKIRILMMHHENPLLPIFASDYEILKTNISQNYTYFEGLTKKNSNIELKLLKNDLMFSFITLNDRDAVVIQYFASEWWGKGPLWKCNRNSKLYQIAKKEFETLWKNSNMD
jgi:hypothetical protein